MDSVPPLVQQYAGLLVRGGLMWAAGYLVASGYLTGEAAEKFAAHATIVLVAIGWSAWEKYKGRQKYLTAAASSKPMTEQQVEHEVKTMGAPSVTTPRDQVPHK